MQYLLFKNKFGSSQLFGPSKNITNLVQTFFGPIKKDNHTGQNIMCIHTSKKWCHIPNFDTAFTGKLSHGQFQKVQWPTNKTQDQ